jgi:hypothetical protein
MAIGTSRAVEMFSTVEHGNTGKPGPEHLAKTGQVEDFQTIFLKNVFKQ